MKSNDKRKKKIKRDLQVEWQKFLKTTKNNLEAS